MPALGQAVQGISSGLSAVGGAAGGLGLGSGAGVRDAVRRLGVKGLDAGLGCGVGVGYGFGAGLFLRPSAVEQAAGALEHAAGGGALEPGVWVVGYIAAERPGWYPQRGRMLGGIR